MKLTNLEQQGLAVWSKYVSEKQNGNSAEAGLSNTSDNSFEVLHKFEPQQIDDPLNIDNSSIISTASSFEQKLNEIESEKEWTPVRNRNESFTEPASTNHNAHNKTNNLDATTKASLQLEKEKLHLKKQHLLFEIAKFKYLNKDFTFEFEDFE